MPGDDLAGGLLSDEQIGGVMASIASLIGILGIANAGTTGQAKLIAQRSLYDHRGELLGPPALSEAVRRQLIGYPHFKAVLQRHGYTDESIELLHSLTPAMLDVGAIQELVRRNELGDGDARILLEKLGYNSTIADLILSLRLFIPSASDVVSFAVREVYSPDVAERFGQYQNFPTDALPDFARAGIDDATARKYWAAHWTLPSVTQGFEMFQRDAETGFTEDDLRKLMRAADIMPYFQDKLIAISYSPLTRVDIRRMHKVGILSRDQVKRAYRDIGYNDERAEWLTQFTEKLNDQEGNDELAPFRATIRTHAQTLYIDGVLTKPQLIEHLTETGITDAEANAYADEAEFIKVGKSMKVVREAVRVAYTGGHINDVHAMKVLTDAGYEPAAIADIMEDWHIVRELREISADERAERDLTKTDIIGAYEDRIINEAEAAAMLIELKYDEHEADVLLRRATLKMGRAERTAAERTQHSLFMARLIDHAAAAKGLIESGVTSERTASLVTDWIQELAARAPTLTKSEVAHAVAKELMPIDEGLARLREMGYGPFDAQTIIALAGGGVVDG